jgi:hypothetical protein
MTEGRYFGWNMLDENLNHILEFGVASGDTLNSNTREINRAFPNKRFTVRGFDTFTGLPEDWTSFDNNIIAFKGVFSTNGVVPELFNDRNDVEKGSSGVSGVSGVSGEFRGYEVCDDEDGVDWPSDRVWADAERMLSVTTTVCVVALSAAWCLMLLTALGGVIGIRNILSVY